MFNISKKERLEAIEECLNYMDKRLDSWLLETKKT